MAGEGPAESMQVPARPGRLQWRHGPGQRLAQQTPCWQKPDWQSSAALHTSPSWPWPVGTSRAGGASGGRAAGASGAGGAGASRAATSLVPTPASDPLAGVGGGEVEFWPAAPSATGAGRVSAPASPLRGCEQASAAAASAAARAERKDDGRMRRFSLKPPGKSIAGRRERPQIEARAGPHPYRSPAGCEREPVDQLHRRWAAPQRQQRAAHHRGWGGSGS